ncbi:hypothetical protein [Kitasatospora sp. NPDC059827]|uniref:hypothetical protein n=1 Tax=Kitasatospora sp. NPDC059827 TaxID=3346964 RepID=UPI003660C176
MSKRWRLPVLGEGLGLIAPATLATVALVGLVTNQSNSKNGESKPVPVWVVLVLAGLVAIVVCYLSWLYYGTRRQALEESARQREALESAADRLRDKMELPSLVDFNRTLLDAYHDIATKQAEKAYKSSRIAMNVGLVVLIAAFGAGWRYNTQGDRLFLGSVAAVGTAFTAYLSRTYMHTYERSLQQLNQYFNQPVLNGYFLTAERLARSLPEDRQSSVMERIIGDVLESGKEMHRGATPGPGNRGVPVPKRRPRPSNQDQPTLPTQVTQ